MLSAITACKGQSDTPTVSDLAELTTRQLIAGLNANNRTVLASLIVLTSTTGGAPRALTEEERSRIVFPTGPFEYVGAGKPGTMLLNDAHKNRRIVRLIQSGNSVKVLASNELYSTYAARELKNAAPVASGDARVLSIMQGE